MPGMNREDFEIGADTSYVLRCATVKNGQEN